MLEAATSQLTKKADGYDTSTNCLLEKINSNSVSHKRVSTIIICKDDWTPENNILTPTMKIKRGNVDKKYKLDYSNWHNSDSKIIWE